LPFRWPINVNAFWPKSGKSEKIGTLSRRVRAAWTLDRLQARLGRELDLPGHGPDPARKDLVEHRDVFDGIPETGKNRKSSSR
jgi:hypothetical protein